MTTTVRLVTAADLMQLPDDGLRRELIAGEVRTIALGGYEGVASRPRLPSHWGRMSEPIV